MVRQERPIIIPRVERGLPQEVEFKKYINGGIDDAFGIVRESFQTHPETPEHGLAFHIVPHSIGVVNRATDIARAIQKVPGQTLVTERIVQLTRFAAAYHDTVQVWEQQTINGADKRMRPRKLQNEEQSAAKALEYMDRVNETRKQQQLSPIFTEEDKAIVGNAILATIPGWDAQRRTVEQPFFETTGVVGKILGLADLGGAGMNTDISQYEAATLYQEENLDYAAYRRRLGSAHTRRIASLRDCTAEANYQTRLIAWLDSQQDFITGREARLSLEVDKFKNKAIEQAVTDLFSAERFADARAQIAQLRSKVAGASFDDWTKAIDGVIATIPPALQKLEE